MSKNINEFSNEKENLFQKLNEKNQNLDSNENKEEKNINNEQKNLLNEENLTQNQNQNSDYKKIYENIKKIKQQLSILEIFRIIIIIFTGLCIYFDVYKSENSKIMFFSTFLLLESSFFILIRYINANKGNIKSTNDDIFNSMGLGFLGSIYSTFSSMKLILRDICIIYIINFLLMIVNHFRLKY